MDQTVTDYPRRVWAAREEYDAVAPLARPRLLPMRSRSWGSLVAAMSVSAVVLTGCGGESGEGGEGGDDDFAQQSAEKISQAAKDAMSDLEAVTIDGTLTSNAQEITIRMEIGSDGNCTGEFSTQGATAEILGVDGTTWFRPDEAFWTLFAGAEAAPAVIAAAGDKWVTLPDDDESFKPFCDLDEFLGSLTGNEDATYTKGDTKEIDGEETIEIISDRPDDGTSSGYIQVDGEHYVVQIEKTEGDEPGSVSFSGFDEQPDVEAPADDEQIALDDLESVA